MQLNQLIESLPPHLLERVRLLPRSSLPEVSGGLVDRSRQGFVLYWMCTAMRVDENPALDVARHLASQLELPWLIYQGLSSRYPFASDRHHALILQGARDVQAECAQRSLPYLFNLETAQPQSRSMLRDLASRASLVIVEEMPTDPPRNFLESLCRKISTPILALDTACVVPMRLVGRAYDRAFAYRDATAKLLNQRISVPYVATGCDARPLQLSEAGYSSIDLQDADLSGLISTCDIDHSIPPVSHTIGGLVAGQQRWQDFARAGLSKYAKLRNNALVDGVSRMSAYLHYGMVSPFRLAREAKRYGGEGAEKFIDELLIWRELAYTYCFYNPEHSTIASIPKWAQQTLLKHQSDPREQLYSWDALAHAETADSLWNAAQKSLLCNGELHNNVRMTWGKALLNWTSDAARALELLIDLNHRYALDGRDPASYGGILWCLGQFDRPFEPEQPIIGTVRPRPTWQHAQRLSPTEYGAKVASRHRRSRKVAVVGAGFAGLTAAHTLVRQGFDVTLFDKSQGPAGRMSTRRADETEWDHGAQYFTVRSDLFRRNVDAWIAEGVVERWTAPIAAITNGVRSEDSVVERFVACPSMNSLGKHLAAKLQSRNMQIHYKTQVLKTERHDANRWQLRDTESKVFGPFDDLIVTTPAPQSIAFLPTDGDEFTAALASLSNVAYDPCWAVLLTLAQPLDVDWGGAFVNSGAIRWIARNQTKPGRTTSVESIVIHANSQFSKANLEASNERVIEKLIDEFWSATGHKPVAVTSAQAHRWRYSISLGDRILGVVSDATSTVHFCGDWSHGSRVEGAFLAGIDAAGKVMRQTVLNVTADDGIYYDMPLFQS